VEALMTAADSQTKCRPFPWRCPTCGKLAVHPANMPYTSEVNYDDQIHVVHVPEMMIPRCRECGELVFSGNIDEPIYDALRSQLQLLKKDELRAGRERVGLSQSALASRLGVSEKTIADWEDGLTIQSRAMDNFLRVYFAIPEVRAVLTGKEQNPALGVLVG
jgi:putative zinc finger/helix-turn-helix YgiT family protein